MSSPYTILWKKGDKVAVKWNIRDLCTMNKHFTYHQRLKVWKGLGDKIDLVLYWTVQPPTPGQLCFELVNNLPISPLEGCRHASVMGSQHINVTQSSFVIWNTLTTVIKIQLTCLHNVQEKVIWSSLLKWITLLKCKHYVLINSLLTYTVGSLMLNL